MSEFTPYVARPVVVHAVQWFENGDCPGDDAILIEPGGGEAHYYTEGKVVRYYRHPRVNGKATCAQCAFTMHHHGWIDSWEGGQVVCPGDWIVKSATGVYTVIKNQIFNLKYVAVKPRQEAYRTKAKARTLI